MVAVICLLLKITYRLCCNWGVRRSNGKSEFTEVPTGVAGPAAFLAVVKKFKCRLNAD